MKIEFNGTPGEVMMEVSDFLELKAPKQNLTPAAAKAVTEVVIDTVKKEAKAKLEKQAAKKEEKTSPADLRTMCAEYCHKVPDGKANIKRWLTDKGYKKVSDISEEDLPEFKALVNI